MNKNAIHAIHSFHFICLKYLLVFIVFAAAAAVFVVITFTLLFVWNLLLLLQFYIPSIQFNVFLNNKK